MTLQGGGASQTGRMQQLDHSGHTARDHCVKGSYGLGAGSFSRGNRKGKCEGNMLLRPFLCCAIKVIFLPALELISTENAWKRGEGVIPRGDIT